MEQKMFTKKSNTFECFFDRNDQKHKNDDAGIPRRLAVHLSASLAATCSTCLSIVQASSAQINKFANLFPMTARPVQSLNQRLLLSF